MKTIMTILIAFIASIFVVSVGMAIAGFIIFYSSTTVIEIALLFNVSRDTIWIIVGGIVFVITIAILAIWKKDGKL